MCMYVCQNNGKDCVRKVAVGMNLEGRTLKVIRTIQMRTADLNEDDGFMSDTFVDVHCCNTINPTNADNIEFRWHGGWRSRRAPSLTSSRSAMPTTSIWTT